MLPSDFPPPAPGSAPESRPAPWLLKTLTVWAFLVPLICLLLMGFIARGHREERRALSAELTELRLAHRAAASRETLTAGALERAARLEEALAVMRREPAPTEPAAEATRAAELERVIVFLRQEITAAHETIERLKQDGR